MVVEVKDTAHSSVILGSLGEIYNHQTFTDVAFRCGDGRTVRAHRLLLSAISPFLQSLCLEQIDKELVEISTPQINSCDLDNVMRYCYEGLIRLEEGEFGIFREIQKMLGIIIPTVVLKGENLEEETYENVPVRTNPTPQAKTSGPLKRRITESSVEVRSSKLRRVQEQEPQDEPHGEMVNSFNIILDNFCKKGKQANPTASSTSTTQRPIIVPLEYYQKMVSVLEQHKAEKKLEALVEEAVKRTMMRVQKQLKNRIDLRKSKHSNSSVKEAAKAPAKEMSTVKSNVTILKHSDSSVKEPAKESAKETSTVKSNVSVLKHSDSSVKEPAKVPAKETSTVKSNVSVLKHSDSSVKEPAKVPAKETSTVKSNVTVLKHSDSSVKEPAKVPAKETSTVKNNGTVLGSASAGSCPVKESANSHYIPAVQSCQNRSAPCQKSKALETLKIPTSLESNLKNVTSASLCNSKLIPIILKKPANSHPISVQQNSELRKSVPNTGSTVKMEPQMKPTLYVYSPSKSGHIPLTQTPEKPGRIEKNVEKASNNETNSSGQKTVSTSVKPVNSHIFLQNLEKPVPHSKVGKVAVNSVSLTVLAKSTPTPGSLPKVKMPEKLLTKQVPLIRNPASFDPSTKPTVQVPSHHFASREVAQTIVKAATHTPISATSTSSQASTLARASSVHSPSRNPSEPQIFDDSGDSVKVPASPRNQMVPISVARVPPSTGFVVQPSNVRTSHNVRTYTRPVGPKRLPSDASKP